MNVVWSEGALRRVEETASWIAENAGREQAEKWVAGLFAKVGVLASAPLIGRQVPEIRRKGVRELIYRRKYRIIYLVKREEDSCLVAAVRRKTTRKNFAE